MLKHKRAYWVVSGIGASFALLAAALFFFYQFYPQKTTYEPLFCLYASELGDDLKYEFLKEVAVATSSIFLASFGISDSDLLKLLNRKAAQGILIQIVCDQSALPYGVLHPNIQVIKDKKSGLMHRKVLIVDEDTVFIGSANATEYSFKLHRNHFIKIKNPLLIKAIKEEHSISDDRFNLFFLPKDKKRAFQALESLIDQANYRIQVAMYALTHQKLVNKLIEAHRRGVAIDIYVDYSMARSISRKMVKKLQKASIQLWQHKEWTLFHHKCALIDDHFITSSANWTKAGFQTNREIVMIFNHLGEFEKKQVESFFTTMKISSKNLKITPDDVNRKSWRIPSFPLRLLSFCSWTPLATYPPTSLFSDRSKVDAHFGSFLEKTA